MRILHVIPGIEWRDGGPSRAIRVMTAALQARGHDVTLATTHPAGQAAAGDVEVPLVSFSRQPANRVKFSLPLAQWLWQETARYDLLHLHAVFCATTLAAGAIARRLRRPYVIRPLGTLDPWSLAHHGRRKRPWFELMERPNLNRAAALHATSTREADNLARLHLKPPVATVPLGIELPPAAPARKLTDPVRLLFLSRLHPVKNLPTLIEAMAILRDRHHNFILTVAGDGEPDYRARLQSQVSRLHLDGLIHFAGWADEASKRDLMAQAHVFVLPSSQENFGIAVAEALAAGLPVVLTHEVALAPDVTAASAGIAVPPGDAEALAEALLQITRADRYDRACAAAAELARQRYGIAAMAASLERLYQCILEQAGS